MGAVLVVLAFPVVYLLVQAGGLEGLLSIVPVDRLLSLTANTLLLAVIVVVSAMVIGTTTAWVVSRRRWPAPRLWSTLMALPLVIPSYVLALVLLAATGQRGILSGLTESAGWGPLPIPRGLLGTALVLIVSTYPYVYLSVRPVLIDLDPAYEEAARSLGAGRQRRFFTVLLPQLAPALRSSGLLVALYTVADFGAVSLLSYDTFTRAIFLQYAGRIDRRPATLLAAALLVLALLILAVARRPRRTEARATARRLAAVDRPPGWLGRVFVGGLLLVALVLPVVILGGWWIRGTLAGRETVAVWDELARSLGASSAAALLVPMVAVPLAVLTVRFRSRLGALTEHAAWTISALPHLTVGLAVLLTGVSLLRPLYQSIPLLLLAYLMMFLPQALGPTQSALIQVPPHLEEASRSLGQRALATFRRITLPLVGKGVLAGAGLVFLTTMKELPATLLLRPTGFETLAVRIWSTTSEGFYTRASFAALMLIVVSAVPFYFLVAREAP